MGQLPQMFYGNPRQAKAFVEEVKAYLRLNYDVAGYESPIKKVAFALTLIKGPEMSPPSSTSTVD